MQSKQGNKQSRQEPIQMCTVCNIELAASSYQPHINGKKHKIKVEAAEHRKRIEETGLFIRGLPQDVNANELGLLFGQFGCIQKIEIHPIGAFVNYVNKESREKALTVKHFFRNEPLYVLRRQIRIEPQVSVNSNAGGSNVKKPVPRSGLDHDAILKALLAATSTDQQVAELLNLTLAPKEYCQQVMSKLSSSVKRAMRSVFHPIETHPFGSMVTGLAFKCSDLDLFVHARLNYSTQLSKQDKWVANNLSPEEIMKKATRCFWKNRHDFTNILAIRSAKTPIVKVLHIPTQVSCDLNFSDCLGFYNSKLLRHYLTMNERFFQLMVIIKYWALTHELTGSNKLSNYAVSMLCISFLQSLIDSHGNRILPTVQDLQQNIATNGPTVDGWQCTFDDSPFTVTLPSSPAYSVLGLLKGFFKYASSLPFATDVVCPLMGELVNRDIFETDPDSLPVGFERYKAHLQTNPEEVLCKPSQSMVVQDPFKLTHNLVGRVQKRDSDIFIEACKKSADICESAHDAEQQLSVFPSLLSLDLIRHSKCVIISHPFKPELAVSEWLLFQEEFKVLTVVFEKLLLLSVIEKGECGGKVQKIAGMQDVHGNSFSQGSFERTLVCEGSYNVWSGRQKARKELQLQNDFTMQSEERITQHLLKAAETLIELKFSCKFVPFVAENGNKKLMLEFIDLTTTKKTYLRDLTNSLPLLLIKWLKTFVQEPPQIKVEEADTNATVLNLS